MPAPGILLITTSGNQQHIAHCCEHAAAAGVRRGMSLAHARALLPLDGVIVEEHNPDRELRRLKSLANWTTRFTPVVSIDPPDGLLLDVTGCERMHRGERRLLNAVGNSIEWLGFRTRIAVASNFACARAMARYGDDRVMAADGDELDALRDLPIEALRLEQETIDALHEVNLTRIGEVARLPRNELVARFGSGLLLRCDQACGDAEEVIESQKTVEIPCVERLFDGPVKQIEGIAITIQELIAQLCAMLQTAESGVRRLDIVFERIDAANLGETIMLSRPSRDARHLWSLLRPRVENVNLGFGVEKVVLSATRIGQLPHVQHEQWPSRDSNDSELEQATGELIDTLANRLGPERITCAVLVESHLPERAVRHEPATVERHSAIGRKPGGVGGDRPTVLFEKPELIEVMSIAPEGPPQWMRWRDEEHTILVSDGPERISDEWWRLAAGLVSRGDEVSPGVDSARDYFRIQIADGRWLWVFRRLAGGRWFVHGEWT